MTKLTIDPGTPTGSDGGTDGPAYSLDTLRNEIGEDVTCNHNKGDIAEVTAPLADVEVNCTSSGAK